ncbi:MAG: ArsC/Spx/MgsR family protein [Chitinophagales bacterium]
MFISLCIIKFSNPLTKILINKDESKILHNNRCSKSRKAVAAIEENNIDFEIVNYLDGVLSENDIKLLLKKLGKSAEEIVRKGEDLYKENYKDKSISENEWIKILQQNPKLIERPILYTETTAVVGRPEENVTKFIKSL